MTQATIDHQGRALDIERVRDDFPVLHQEVHGAPLVFFDNAASSQRPSQVIETVRRYYERDHANVHRGIHTLSQRATEAYEGAREKVRAFINARAEKEIVFVRGATEAINLVANSWGRRNLSPGDEVIISHMEHHSNIVPWQMVCQATGAKLRVIPITDAGELDMQAYRRLFGKRTRFVAVTAVSNALGTVTPAKELVRIAHDHRVPILIDGCQAVPHMPVDVQDLGADFLVFSGHKMFGPTGIGVLYGREDHLEAMPPWQGGGEMIDRVTFEETTWADLPNKFEAGTPNIAGAIGLGAAVDYVNDIGLDAIQAWESGLLEHATRHLEALPEVRILGTAEHKAAVISFLVGDAHPTDVATLLDMKGIAVRTGHHCAQPVMQRFGIPATVRASFAFYNTPDEIDRFVAALKKVIPMVC